MENETHIIGKYFSAFLLFLFSATKVFAQISPGNLTYYHAKYEGLSNCTLCHVLGKQIENSRCLSCHTEINSLISQDKGYHASPEVKNKDCWSCHSEHHGRDFRIINFDLKEFDHEVTGFKLDGKHSRIDCIECHQSKFISNPELKKRENTYLGLDKNCITCHEDPHQNTLGTNCSSCHNTEKFKPAANFDHNKTNFVLTGAHEKVECSKCHITEKRNGQEFQKFVGLQFSNCTPCHRDVHQKKFGENCKKCHTDVSFKLIKTNSFDHDLTNYPLRGLHVEVSCKNCHGKDLNSRPKHDECIDCHRDYHKGQFTKNNIVTDCSKCHTVESFKLATYTIEMHNKTEFELTGSHLAVSCKSCHYPVDSWQFEKIGLKCIDCHKNVHGTELTNQFLPDNKCTVCHSTESWQKISFDHDKTKFKLLGKHLTVGCRACHYTKTHSGLEESVFRSLNSDCETCHKDIHYGQFAKGKITDCQRCHGFENWTTTTFDHNRTSFHLTGAHEKLGCVKCHKVVTVNGNTFVKYKLENFKCESCHSS